jgi:CelD/BcsL family acetyltransferase involved in cellulose biosynthesis
MLPAWVQVWWRHFGGSLSALICAVWSGSQLIGIAPLGLHGETARLLGSADVCDYLDCVIAPGHEQAFFSVLLEHLKARGIVRLELGPVRADSTILCHGVAVARELGCTVVCDREDSTFACVLPHTWEGYLSMLSSKQRHEARRKLHRLEAAGTVSYRAIEDAAELEVFLPAFLHLFRASRPDKAAFMTDRMAAFFYDLSRAMAAHGLLQLGLLELKGRVVASVLCFDYQGTRFLYNSGYDRHYGMLNAGFVSKLLSIRDSLSRGCTRYDFLKGEESYKKHLGGVAAGVYRCRVALR